MTKVLSLKGHRIRFFTVDRYEAQLSEYYAFNDLKMNLKHKLPILDLIEKYYSYLEVLGYPTIILTIEDPICTYLSYSVLHNNKQNRSIPICSWIPFYSPTNKELDLINLGQAYITSQRENIIQSSLIPFYTLNLQKLQFQMVNNMNNEIKIAIQIYNELDCSQFILKCLSRCSTPWRLFMIGKGMEELIFKQLVADFNVNDKINWVNDGEKLLESVSLVIQTSYLNESVAYIKKAIQHKIPVLSLISNETLEFIHPHQNGWFFEPDDEERVVKILDKFLKNPSI